MPAAALDTNRGFLMSTKLRTHAYVILVVALMSVPAYAHHSSAHFSSEVTELEGTLIELRWRNPHILFILETEEAGGQKKVWELEAGTIYMIGRAGVTREMFTVGETIRVAGNRSETFDDKFWVENILTSDGKEKLVVAGGAPYFTDEVIGGRQQWTNEAFIQNAPPKKGSGIYRVWSPATRDYRNRLAGDPTNNLGDIVTDAARAAGASWDPYAFDAECKLPGLPRVNHGPHPHQFIEDGDNILLLAEEFYLTRTIHMNSSVDPETVPRSPLGYSVGRWEDENTLIVETSRINFPYMNLGGIGQSENVRIYERYVVSEDENRLDFEVILKDPGMITEPLVKRGVWLDIGETIDETYDCVPTVAAEQ
jgi:hypothetical protein